MAEPLSHAEWKVMKIIWKAGPCAARDVYQRTRGDTDWAMSTVKTLLHRLTEKGYLHTTQVGNSFLYKPTQRPLKSLLGAADALLDNVLDGLAGPLLAHMVKKSKLKSEELAQLRALLAEQTSEENS